MLNSLFLVKTKEYLARLIVKVLTAPFIPINSYLVRKYGQEESRVSPVFIVGAPRTGSTIFYQALTNQFEALYFDNLSARLCHIPIIGFWLSELFFKGKAHNCFSSKYGNTSGLRSPSECGEYWNRFFPNNRHFIDYEDFDSIDTKKLKAELVALSKMFGKTIIFKNLNAGQRLRLLSKLFPEARIIFITRQPFFTAQSILMCKRKQGINVDQFWSIKPSNFEQLKALDWFNQIPQQIYYLEKQICEDLKLFPQKNVFQISYLDLCSETFENMGKTLNLVEKTDYESVELRILEKETLPFNEVDLLKQSINSLNWQFKYEK